MNPRQSARAMDRGLGWIDRGNLDRAIENFDRAVSLDPGFAPAYCNRGSAWAMKGMVDGHSRTTNGQSIWIPNTVSLTLASTLWLREGEL